MLEGLGDDDGIGAGSAIGEYSALAFAETLVRSIARRCRIQRLHRRVVLARGSTNAGIRCWKILVAHSVLSQVNRGTRTCSLVGCPMIGRSVTRRST